MKLISIDSARSLQLFLEDEINPRKGGYLPAIIDQVAERYGFAERPLPKRDGGGLKFKDGRFVSAEHDISIYELVMYSDGVIVQAANTDYADIAVGDFVGWFQQTLDIPDPIHKFPRSYGNNMVIDFDGPIDHVLSCFEMLGAAYDQAIGTVYGVEVKSGFSRFTLGLDEKPTPALVTSDFTIERRAGSPFSENRYFCSAPLPTAVHLTLLQQFEDYALRRTRGILNKL